MSVLQSVFNQNNHLVQNRLSYDITKTIKFKVHKTKLNSVALVRERTITTEQPPPVGEVSANFCG